MWRIGLLALTACWTPSAPTTSPAAVPVGCEIRDANVDLEDAATLLVGGISFARLQHGLTRFDVVVAGTHARVHLETEELELSGDLRLAGLGLRKRKQLYDEWLLIRRAALRAERNGSVDAAVPLPAGVRPQVFVATLPCSEVTFASGWGDDAMEIGDALGKEGDEELQFDAGTRTPLAKRAGGAALVHLEPTRPLRAIVLERRGPYARIAISHVNAITGWVSTEHARRVKPDAMQGFGFGRSGYSKRTVHCPHDVKIYVDTSARIHHVGRYKAGATITLEGDGADDAVRVDLGGGEVDPHVDRAELAACTTGSARD